MKEFYRNLESMSFDVGILEKLVTNKNLNMSLRVIEGKFDWIDVGNYDELIKMVLSGSCEIKKVDCE
jgi:mannose-1-phosphate guanylyltransferase